MHTLLGALGFLLIAAGALLLVYAIDTRRHVLGIIGAWVVLVGMAFLAGATVGVVQWIAT
jgi:hypothetical protein